MLGMGSIFVMFTAVSFANASPLQPDLMSDETLYC